MSLNALTNQNGWANQYRPQFPHCMGSTAVLMITKPFLIPTFFPPGTPTLDASSLHFFIDGHFVFCKLTGTITGSPQSWDVFIEVYREPSTLLFRQRISTGAVVQYTNMGSSLLTDVTAQTPGVFEWDPGQILPNGVNAKFWH